LIFKILKFSIGWPGQAEIDQAGGWPIGRAGRLTSLIKVFYGGFDFER
jgi:hypothetical protein